MRKQAKVSKVAQREAAALVAAENAKTEFEGASKQNKTRRKPTDRALVLALCQAFHTSLVSTKAGEKAITAGSIARMDTRGDGRLHGPAQVTWAR